MIHQSVCVSGASFYLIPHLLAEPETWIFIIFSHQTLIAGAVGVANGFNHGKYGNNVHKLGYHPKKMANKNGVRLGQFDQLMLWPQTWNMATMLLFGCNRYVGEQISLGFPPWLPWLTQHSPYETVITPHEYGYELGCTSHVQTKPCLDLLNPQKNGTCSPKIGFPK